MRRIPIQPRPDWQKLVEVQGLTFHTHEGLPYWNESAYYEFDESEILAIESATNDLHKCCMSAIDHIIANRRYVPFGLTEASIDAIEWSWEHEPPTLYGRFDFIVDGIHPPKMLEYNADTPTSLLEAAVIQWKWLEERFPERDQFNAIWEGLVNQWQWLKDQRKLSGALIHFGHCDLEEDELTIAVLRDTAHQVGIETRALMMDQIGWDEQNHWFVDQLNMRIWTMFKLYPWEWMAREDFGDKALRGMDQTQWIEPAWKMLLANKSLLPILWELNPGHPNLLPSFEDDPHGMTRYVKKPKLGREGANVQIIDGGENPSSEGTYGTEGFVYQEYCELPNFDGNRPVSGSWVIGEDAQGMGIRETDGPITDNFARFVPHVFG